MEASRHPHEIDGAQLQGATAASADKPADAMLVDLPCLLQVPLTLHGQASTARRHHDGKFGGVLQAVKGGTRPPKYQAVLPSSSAYSIVS